MNASITSERMFAVVLSGFKPINNGIPLYCSSHSYFKYLLLDTGKVKDL